MAVRMASAAAVLGSQLAIANLLGIEAFGDYAYALSWVAVLAILSQFGQDSASLRFVASYTAQSQWPLLRGFLRSSTACVFVVASASAVGMAAVVWASKSAVRPELFMALLVGAGLVVALALAHLKSFQLQGLKRIVSARGPLDMLRPLLTAGGIAAVWSIRGNAASLAAEGVAINLSGTIIVLILTEALLRRALPHDARQATVEYERGEWLRVGIALLLLSGLAQVLSRSDVVMLGIMVSTEQAGVYAVAALLSQGVFLGLSAVNVFAAPTISALHAARRDDELRRFVRHCAWASFGIAVPIGGVLVLAGPWILSLFGEGFADGYWPLVVLCIGQFVNAASGSVGFLLTMTGHQNQAARIMAMTAVANLALNFALIPLLGMVGAAIATASTTALWNVSMLVYARRRIGINASIFAFGRTRP
jgi:O-antigen/teichoic acid export membrane protein